MTAAARPTPPSQPTRVPAPPTPADAPTASALVDTMIMVKRQLVHGLRYPVFFYIVGMPLVLLLLFTYVFGGTLGRGIGGDSGDYLDYLLPGLLVLTLAGGMQLTALSVSQDMNEGIVSRFRSMPISRGSVLAGHVIGNGIQQFLAVIVVLLVGVALGFRPTATGIDYLALAGFVLVLLVALGWLAVAMGVQAKSVEAASNLPMIVVMFPFMGSGFVPTDSMPEWMQVFAEVQPFTPFIETVRGLLMGTEIGPDWWVSLLWCAGLAALGYVWARLKYEHRTAR